MLWADRIIALALIAGVFPLWQISERFPGTSGIFPRVTLVVLGILSLVLLARSFWPGAVRRRDGEGETGLAAMARPVAVFVLVGLAAAGMRNIGFFPVMVAMAAALFWVLGGDRPRFYVAAIAILLVMIYVVFVRVLSVPLTAATLFG